MTINLDLEHVAPAPKRKDYWIGAIGAGFIMSECHLVAYGHAGYKVVAITSASAEESGQVARAHGIPKVYGTYQELLADPSTEVADIAVPPDKQLMIVREAVKHSGHLKGILAQKPLAMSFADAKEIVRPCEQAGITLAVNQNMRYDHSMRALKTLLKRGYLGEPVLASIEMRAIPHWKPWQLAYTHLTLLNMSIHHLDSFRFLFGEPESVYVSARKDPRTRSEHLDGVVPYIGR
jgi:predicted dehydrogenase